MILAKKAQRQAGKKAALHLGRAVSSQATMAAAAPTTIAQAALVAKQAAVSRLALAQLELTATESLSTAGYCVFKGNETFSALANGLLDVLPDNVNPGAAPWKPIFNTVPGTRFQVELNDVTARSPYQPVKKCVTSTVGPLFNSTIMGLGHKQVSKPTILLSKKTSAEDALAQGPHRDWPVQR